MSTEILINRYKVLERLGEGAMGAVWLVEDATCQTLLAMKVLVKQLEGAEKSFLQLKQEFRLMTQLRHPNCCAVYDYGQLPDGNPYLTMELVPGQGLDEMFPLQPDEFRSLLGQLLMALGYVGQLGYVHSDIKSQNVRVKPDGTVKLMDYGLMELAGRSGAPIKGTLAYLAPEVVKRGKVDQRADLYALGCLAYEMLSGEPPFMSRNPMDVLRAHVNEAPRPLSHVVSVPPELERIVMKLLAKDPLDRYQSAYEALVELGVDVPAGIGGNLLSSPMMGRDEPLEALASRLVAIAKWQPGDAVLLTGAAGIGKSRLVEEFRYLVQMEDLTYASGSLVEGGATPYAPMVEILRKLLPGIRDHAGPALLAQAPVLVKLVPELGQLLGLATLTPAPDLDPPAREKMRLQATVSELLVQLAIATPLVLALEDWQWADPLSVELLEYLLRNTREASILFVITARKVPDAVAAWGDRVEHVPLEGLDARGIWRMVTSMLGTEAVGARFLGQISEFSSGNPFMIERLLEHLVREEVLVSERGRWNTQIELATEQLPSDMGALLMAKIEDLTPAARDLAHAAAVIGRGITLDLLQTVMAPMGDDVLFDAITELLTATVLEQDEHDGYRFGQEQLLELLYENLAFAERVRLHGAVVAALEHRIWGKDLTELAFEEVRSLAHHSLKGSVPEKTIVYALETGARLLALNAPVDAERFLSDGLALVRLEPGGRWRRQLLDYLRHLADVYRFAAKLPLAKELLLEAIPVGEELGKQLLVGRMLTTVAKICQMQTDYEGALEHALRSVDVAAAAGDLPGEGRAVMTIGRVHFFKGRLAEALESADRAATIGRASGDPSILAGAFAMGGYFGVASGQPDRLEPGVRDLNESLALQEQAGDKLGLMNSLSFMGNAQAMLGDYIDAWATFVRMRQLAFESGSKDDEIVALVNLATSALELGNAGEAVERAKEARELIDKRNSSKYAKGLAVAVEALGSLYLGQPSKSRDLAQSALDFTREIKNKYVEALALPFQLEVLLLLGQEDEAREVAKILEDLILETKNTEPEGKLNVLKAELLGREGRLDEALVYAEKALEAAHAAQSKGLQVRAGRTLAWLCLRAERWADAERYASDAYAVALRIGAKAQAQEAAALLGELALATGRAAAEADGHFAEMEDLARQTHVKQALALALFGRAAARPCAVEAVPRATEALELLRTLTTPMDAEAAIAFMSLAERQRIEEGNFHAYGLPLRLSDRSAALWLRLRTFHASAQAF